MIFSCYLVYPFKVVECANSSDLVKRDVDRNSVEVQLDDLYRSIHDNYIFNGMLLTTAFQTTLQVVQVVSGDSAASVKGFILEKLTLEQDGYVYVRFYELWCFIAYLY